LSGSLPARIFIAVRGWVFKRHSNVVEHLCYPTNGIMFILQSDQVLTFTIEKKVEPEVAPNRSSFPLDSIMPKAYVHMPRE